MHRGLQTVINFMCKFSNDNFMETKGLVLFRVFLERCTLEKTRLSQVYRK